MKNIVKGEVKNVKLNWIEAKNLKTGLEIDKIEFNKDITLLVGVSGVGKTQILNAISYTLALAINKNIKLKPYKAKISIQIQTDIYIWEYCIEENLDKDLKSLDGSLDIMYTYEKLLKNEELLYLRNKEEIFVWGYEKVPTPKKDESLLIQYSEADIFKELVIELKKIYAVDLERDVRFNIKQEGFNDFQTNIGNIIEKNRAVVDYRMFSHYPVSLKLFLIKKYFKDVYVKIFDIIKELFIEIEDIDIKEDALEEIYLVAIKVYGKELLQHEISSGMLKTIYYIIELITMSDNSLVLIDEFENGLGVNCIDLLSEIILSERSDLQFVITSHHPKIINQISSAKWKIIDRDISTIKNISSEAYGIGSSQHDAYFNLINRWEFEGKI